MSKSLWKLSWDFVRQLHAFLYSGHYSPEVAKSFYKVTMDSKDDFHHLHRRRASQMRITYGGDVPTDADTFEHILNVTTHNEALLAYYYLDSDNKMKMTEIYDVTDADTDAMQTPHERHINKQLEFDNDWSGQLMCDDLDLDNTEDDLDDRNLFSDPESEWTRRQSYSNDSYSEGDQPESDRQPVSYIVTYAD